MDLVRFQGLDYEPQELESETLLSEMPLSIIMQSIESQFNDPYENSKTDYVQSFITRYKVTEANIEDDDEIEELEKLYITFLSFMEQIFANKLSIGIPEIGEMSKDEQLELIHYIYRFFLTNIKKNFITFILSFIKENKKDLVKILPLRKDIRMNKYKDIITDPTDLCIIINMGDIISIALSNPDIDVDSFLSLSRGDGSNLENDFISDHYENFTITGNFVPRYCSMVTEGFRVELECKIYSKILKKYKKK